MNQTKPDTIAIFEEQKATFRMLFECLDLSKVVFVGGVADYLNLRAYYEMPVHDIDIRYTDNEDLEAVREHISLHQHSSEFYECEQNQVLVGEYVVNQKSVHVDFFKPNFKYYGYTTSTLLGREVRHSSFQTMKRFHNDHIAKLTSSSLGPRYKWKRLYKHSKKASLYNLVSYQEEKESKIVLHA